MDVEIDGGLAAEIFAF